MRPVLLVSLALATVAVGAAAMPFLSPRGPGKGAPAAPLVAADATPVRTIPIHEAPTRVRRVDVADAAPAAGPGTWSDPAPKDAPRPVAEPAAAKPDGTKPKDVLASVGQTLAALREAEPPAAPAAEAVPAGGALTSLQEEALRKVAARRKVRPVTKVAFPLEVGASVPSAVYLHPVPPEVAVLAPGNLGFALVGTRAVVVSTESRQVVALGGA